MHVIEDAETAGRIVARLDEDRVRSLRDRSVEEAVRVLERRISHMGGP